MGIGGITMIQKLSRRLIRQGFLRKYINEIRGHLKGLMLKRKRNKQMTEESANHVVNCSNFMSFFYILRISMMQENRKRRPLSSQNR